MKRLLPILLLLAACGQMPAHESKPAPAGVYTDSTVIERLADDFEAVKACTEFANGEFPAMAIVQMLPRFPCRYYPEGCEGEFVPPNTIKIGYIGVFRHEALHYLLYVNTGNADPGHGSELFWRCG